MRPKIRHATLVVELSENKKVISAILSSLSPEIIRGKRLTFTLSTANGGRTLLLKFSAVDLVSLRAGMNTVLRLTVSALKSIRTVSAFSQEESERSLHRKTE